MFPKDNLLCAAALAAALVAPAFSWGEEPPRPASREAWEADVANYVPFFRGWLGPEYGVLAPDGSVSRWNLGLTLDGTYTDNVDLNERQREAFYSDANVSLSALRRSPRMDASLEGRYTFPVYRSSAMVDRNSQTWSLAGAGRWQAGRYLSLSAGGSVDQNAERGVQSAPEGVPSDYTNRYDNYNAHAEYEWRLSQSLRNTGSYRYHYRNYRSGASEGEDVRSHDAGTSFELRPTSADALAIGYDYGYEESMPGANSGLLVTEERTNHKLNASWTRQLWFSGDVPTASVRLAYALDRALYSQAEDYSNHSLTLGGTKSLSPRTDAGAHVGLQWLIQGGENSDKLWSWGVDLSHQFTPYTKGAFSASRSLEYVPASSRTERTTLTDVQRVSLRLDSQIARYWDGSLNGSYERGKPEQVGSGSNDYWSGQGAGSLRVRLAEQSFLGFDARLTRRCTQDSDEDYWLYSGGISYQVRFWRWLSGTLGVSHERRRPDDGSTLQAYKENRVYASATVEL